MSGIALTFAVIAVLLVVVAVLGQRVCTRPMLTTPAERVVHATLRTASLAAVQSEDVAGTGGCARAAARLRVNPTQTHTLLGGCVPG